MKRYLSFFAVLSFILFLSHGLEAACVEGMYHASSIKREGREKVRDLKKAGARGRGLIFPKGWPTKVYVPRDTKAIDMADKRKQQDEMKRKAELYLKKKPSARAETILAQEPIVAEQDGFYLYETHHYRLMSQVKLSDEAAEVVGRLFECSYALSQAVAIALPIARVEAKKSARGNKLSESKKIDKLEGRIYKSKAAYVAIGAPETTAGVFRYAARVRGASLKEEDIVTDAVHIPVESMGISSEGEVEKGFDSHTLVHEITHQLTVLNGLPIWANEGMSEYMGYIPYDGDVLDIKVCFANILSYARLCSEYKRLDFPFSLEHFFLMSQQEMYAYMGQNVDTYALSAMCISYFIHLNRDGLAAYQAYMKALLEGKANREAVEHLLGDFESMAELQEDFIEAWEKQKVSLKFGE
ncbi:MAG: hypothetical protein R3Y56_04735 [Akkermansia sp.]